MRYIVGIDLGTTNSTVSYIDTLKDRRFIQIFQIPQITGLGSVGSRSTLPSFCYIASAKEFPKGALDLPWKKGQKFTVGAYALQYGSEVPTGLVSSAKSWLCYHSARQKEAILPVDSRDDAMRISPIEASCRYLNHIREAWNHTIAEGNPDDELEQQEIILTVPASFDEVARALTAEAAKKAGFEKITFLEEPQAAFYNWIAQHEARWQTTFKEGESILVCDVGGGTTDFSLIRFRKEGEACGFERMAVGDHLLLGGDNIDLALAYYLENKLQNEYSREPGHDQWKRLCHEARQAKEALLSGAATTYTVALQGRGSSIVEGSLRVVLDRDEVIHLLTEGFFPVKPWSEAIALIHAKGLRSNGLPFEDDPCITKQLAHFLETSCRSDAELPRHLLFNGGTMMAPAFQEAVKACYKMWFPHIPLHLLSVKNMELAVSKGAAYFGRVRRGDGVSIKAGSPRSFYLELNAAGEERKALCLLPRGTQEGTSHTSERQFSAIANSPVSFTLHASHTRIGDDPGAIIPIDPSELHPLPPISTILRFGKKSIDSQIKEVPISIAVAYTTLGTLEMWLQSKNTDHRWNLEFQVKASSGQDDQLSLIKEGRRDETYNLSYLAEAKSVVSNLYTSSAPSPTDPEKIVDSLEGILEQPRLEWPPSILRGLWEELLKNAKNRKLSPAREARWWNLAGLLLRPGFGYPLDDHRMKEFWKVILSETAQKVSPEVALQKCICLRRVSGGLNKGQQTQIYHQITPSLFDKKSGRLEQAKGMDKSLYIESVRLLAALERIDFKAKSLLGKAFIEAVVRGKGSCGGEFLAVGRMGARQLLYASQANVLPVEEASTWVETLLPHANGEKETLALALIVRKTSHPEINVKKELREKVKHLTESTHLHRIIDGSEALTTKEEDAVFGDHLPPGILLNN